MKKFGYLFFSVIFCIFCTFSLAGCGTSELEKASKNLTCYAISAELSDDMKISACEKITYINSTGEKLDYICLHLYARAFRDGAIVKPYTSLNAATCFPNGISYGDIEITGVSVNGESKTFELVGEDEDVLKIAFGFSLDKNKSILIDIDFNLTIPNSTHRLGYFKDNINLGNWYPVICKFEGGKFDTTPYYSTGDPFYSDIANYNVKFKFPKKYILSSTGEIILSENADKTSVEINAKAVRDFAMCLSSNACVLTEKVGDTKVYYMGYGDDKNAAKYMELAKNAVAFFNKTFGKYPYSTLTIAKTPFVFGGMEYPNIVFVSDSVVDEKEYIKVIVHEIAHQWWYGLVGNNEISEAWLDESISEFSTVLFFEEYSSYGLSYKELIENAISSYQLYVDVIETIKGEVNTKMNLKINEYQNDYEYSYMVYVKGIIMFDSLKTIVGEQKVIAGLKKYYQDNKFKIATKADFYKAFKSACHKDLEGFFEGYLNGTTIISAITN